MMLCTDCPDAADCSGSCCCTQEPEPVELVTCCDYAVCSGCGCCGEHDVEPVVPVVPVVPPTMAAVVVAIGETNTVAVPCLTFATVVEAERFLAVRFGRPDSNGHYGPIAKHFMAHGADDFFTDYRPGDVYDYIDAFEVREVQHGKPIVAFDLD